MLGLVNITRLEVLLCSSEFFLFFLAKNEFESQQLGILAKSYDLQSGHVNEALGSLNLIL